LNNHNSVTSREGDVVRFIIYGAGAIGSIIGGHLHRTGHDVVLVGNQRHVDKINAAGLKLITPEETYVLKVPAVKEAIDLVPFGESDVVLLTAKSQHTILCLGQLKNAGAKRELPIFCVQNSIVNEPAATRAFDRVYGVVVNLPGIFLQPGEVINPISGNSGFLEAGLYPRGVDELAHDISRAFRVAGFTGGVNEWVMKAKAAKCLLNLSNSMDAITDRRGDGSAFIKAARKEAEVIWGLAGIEWEDLEDYERRVRAIRGVNRMPKGYEGESKRSSSWQSLVRGTGNIEAEALNGDVVILGRSLRVKAPYNEVLWRVAEDMASKGEKPGRYSAEDLLRMVQEKT
jgi:2-dehydropantoate 2-reductase